MNPRDMALQTLTPTVMVPRHEDFTPLASIGHRFLVASDGLWMEIRRAWLYARLPVARQAGVPMPYGVVTPVLELLCGKVPKQLLVAFEGLAQAALPNETAAVVIWNEVTGEMRLQPLEAVSASAAHVTYKMSETDEGEHVVMDLHSHGASRAFFSGTDDADDATAIKVAGVVGNLDKPEPTYAFRLCALGRFVTL